MASSGETFNRTFQGGQTDRVRDRSVRETRQSLKRQAIPPYTVYNLHHFPLFVSLGDMGYIRVPARGKSERYGKFLIGEPRFTMRDLGDGQYSAEVVFPEVLAREVAREYAETGGVFVAQGEGAPGDEAMAAAREAQLQWYRREYRKAVDAWYRYHQHKFITDRQRDAARELALLREIPTLPEWVDATQETAQDKICPYCGEAIKAVATVCRYCRSGLQGAVPPAAVDQRNEAPQPQPEAGAAPEHGAGTHTGTPKPAGQARTKTKKKRGGSGAKKKGAALSQQRPLEGAGKRDAAGRFSRAATEPVPEASGAAEPAKAGEAGALEPAEECK